MNFKIMILIVAMVVVFGCTIPDSTPTPLMDLPPAPSPETSTPQPDSHTYQEEQPTLRSKDVLYLARLCVMEAVGMSDGMRDVACLSVVSTVLTRTRLKFLSDGTIASTLSWHSGDTWQFAGYLVDGCRDDMPARSCPDNWTKDIKRFEEIIRLSFRDENFRRLTIGCEGYLFYNSIPGGNVDCLLEDWESGQFIEFYKQAYPESAPIILRLENVPQ